MYVKCRFLRAMLLALCVFSATARAALPDPTTFSWAVENGNISSVKAWLDEGLSPEFQAKPIGSGLMIAAWYGNIEMMALFVERGADLRSVNQNGEQALQLAAWQGQKKAVEWLLERGAPLNREGNNWGPLHYAVFNGHTELAKDLIARGAEVNAASPNGSTPLMMAAREGREELTKVLMESGADPRSKNDWGDNALTMAMRYDHFRIGKMIASPEEFAIAVKAPKESFGVVQRSAAAPNEIEDLLKRIREIEAQGQSADELRQQLWTAINTFRRNAIASKNSRRPMPLPYQPRSIVITAKRGKPGVERAQVVTAKPAAKTGAASTTRSSIVVTPIDQRVKQAQVADLMHQIRLAEAQGQPTDGLRQQLYDAVEALKK